MKIGQELLPADLSIPKKALGVVIFAHGSGSSRLSPRNRFVARALGEFGLATLLFDLLTEQEAEDRANVFDITLLAGRMREAIACVHDLPELRRLRIGLFGASTGAAAALRAAAEEGEKISAVVSRGGRPDLASGVLGAVAAPTLLIVGGLDEQVIRLNEQAFALLRCEKRLEIVPGASHLFEEAGKMEQVISLATQWFTQHLAQRERP